MHFHLGFIKWANTEGVEYRRSNGNGSCMRVSPISLLFDDLKTVETIVDICNILDVDVNCIFKGLVDYRIQNKDKKLIDNILSLAKEDKDIIEKLVQHLGKK